jgi:hypothetical protein
LGVAHGVQVVEGITVVLVMQLVEYSVQLVTLGLDAVIVE